MEYIITIYFAIWFFPMVAIEQELCITTIESMIVIAILELTRRLLLLIIKKVRG